MSSSRLSIILARLKRLAIGPRTYTGILSFLQTDDTMACRYWTQERLQEFAAAHPDQVGCLLVGCGLVQEDQWCQFGAGNDETVAPRDCSGCEYFGLKD